MKKDKFLYGLIIALILMLIGSTWYNRVQQNKMQEKIEESNKVIISMDKTTKESEGQYSKLVDYFKTEKELNQQLRLENKKLFKTIKNQNEKLLMINNTIVSMKSQIEEGFGSIDKTDTNIIDLKLKYPKEGESFINWSGYVNRKTAFYKGEWSFGKLPLKIVMTETDGGLWKSRLVGPEWLVVDSIQINSLPLNKPEVKKQYGLMLGGGYYHSLDKTQVNEFSIGGGINLNNHKFILNITTNNTIGFSYYYNILNFSKK
jgi:cell division protein FtsL